MKTLGLYVRLDAIPGKEAEVEDFLKEALPLVNAEPGTLSWYTWRQGPSSFGIFDTFEDEDGRQSHMMGEVAKALFAKAPELFSTDPQIEKIELLAAK